jgi:ribonuclease P protein component
VQVLARGDDAPSRFGFIVAKSVGNAVTRNLVRRRMRAAGREALLDISPGVDVVIRALPASAEVSWVTLHSEIIEGVNMGLKRS